MASGIICQACGVEAPTRYVEFYQNIGALIMRFHSSAKGNLCKSCIHQQFWKRTMTTAGVGWFGTISLVITPIYIIMNTVNYLGALGMKRVPPGAQVPRLTDETVAKLAPVATELIERLNRREPLESVACDLGPRVGVTPGQVVHYLIAIMHNRSQQMQPAQGFPVQPVRSTPPPLPVAPAAVAPIPVEPVAPARPAEQFGM